MGTIVSIHRICALLYVRTFNVYVLLYIYACIYREALEYNVISIKVIANFLVKICDFLSVNEHFWWIFSIFYGLKPCWLSKGIITYTQHIKKTYIFSYILYNLFIIIYQNIAKKHFLFTPRKVFDLINLTLIWMV